MVFGNCLVTTKQTFTADVKQTTGGWGRMEYHRLNKADGNRRQNEGDTRQPEGKRENASSNSFHTNNRPKCEWS